MPTTILTAILISIIMGIIGFGIGFALSKKSNQTKIKEASGKAKQIVNDAKRETETLKRVSILETKENIAKENSRFEKMVRDRKSQIRKSEIDIQEKGKDLSRKNDLINRKETEILKRQREVMLKEKTVKAKNDRLSKIIDEENRKLEHIAQLSKDEAIKILMINLETEAKLKSANMTKKIKEDALQTANKEAKERFYRFQDEKNIHNYSSYIRKIVDSTVIDQLRRFRRQAGIIKVEKRKQISDHKSQYTMSSTSERDHSEIIGKAIESLMESRRRPVRLFLLNMTLEEISI